MTRWGKRDAFGQALLAATNEIAAPDDRTMVFRLKRPFPLLPDALGKVGVSMCPIMPERLAKTDAFTQVTEMVGSGPYRFVANERVPGAKAVYERFAGYQPRGEAPALTSGGKVATFDRVEWVPIPDAATALGALQNGEVDWWEQPTFDLLPAMQGDNKLTVEVLDPSGNVSMLRMNQLHPPFDRPEIRRALLGAVNQADYMTAVAGTDPQWWTAGVGYFPPSSPLQSDAGMAALTGPRDVNKVKAAVRAAGYHGEPVVEELRDAWVQAPDLAAQKAVGVAMQAHAFDTVPFLPLGKYLQPTCYSTSLKGVLHGMPIFWNVERA